MRLRDLSKNHSLYSLVILLLLTFIIGNLIYNIQYLDLPAETIPLPSGTGGTEALTEVGGSAEAWRWFFIGIVATFFIIAIVGIAWSIFSRKSLFSKWELTGYLMGLLILGIFLLSLPNILEFFKGLFANGGSSPSAEDGGGTGDIASTGQGYPIGAVVLLVMAIVIVAFLVISKRASANYASRKAKRSAKSRTELLRYVESAIEDLELGGDPREVIIRCYRNLSLFMGGKGIAQEPHYTPREFERLVKTRTGLKGKDLRELTALFEEARYSVHELTSADKARAAQSLRNFKSEIEGKAGV